jgi:hypothetical protein
MPMQLTEISSEQDHRIDAVITEQERRLRELRL